MPSRGPGFSAQGIETRRQEGPRRGRRSAPIDEELTEWLTQRLSAQQLASIKSIFQWEGAGTCSAGLSWTKA